MQAASGYPEPVLKLKELLETYLDPAKVEWAYELRRRRPPQTTDPTGVANVARTGVSELIPEITQEMIEAANITDPEILEVVERLQLDSVMYIPLIARGRLVTMPATGNSQWIDPTAASRSTLRSTSAGSASATEPTPVEKRETPRGRPA